MANDEYVWDYLVNTGMSEYGVAGLMGNFYHESGMNFNSLENLCRKRIKEHYGTIYSNEEYTDAIDNGTIDKEGFLHPIPGKQYGYGLCQWTTPERKEYLYDLAKERKVSIADPETQLDVVMHELEIFFPTLWKILKNATSVKQASDEVLVRFEAPTDKSDSVKATRANTGQKYFDKFHK